MGLGSDLVSLRHSTYVKSPGGVFIRSSALAKVRDIPSQSYYTNVKMIRAVKGYRGFPNYPAGVPQSFPWYTHKVVSASWSHREVNNNYDAGGTDDCSSTFGAPTGSDFVSLSNILVPLTTYWNEADQVLASPTYTLTTKTGSRDGGSSTATISNLRETGYSQATAAAASGLWSNGLLSSPPCAMICGFDEWMPPYGWMGAGIDVTTYGGPYSGTQSSWSSDTPYYGGSYVQNTMGPLAHPGSGWYLSGYGNSGGLYVQRAYFTTTGAPIWYWFGEIKATAAAGVIQQVHYFRRGGILYPGGWVEVPSPTTAPTTSFPYMEDFVVAFINTTPQQWIAANPGWTLV